MAVYAIPKVVIFVTQIRVVLVGQNSDLVIVSGHVVWDLNLVLSHGYIPRLAGQDF